MSRFVWVFVGILLALFGVELLQPVQNAVVLPWTNLITRLTAAVLIPLDGSVKASGKLLQHSITGVGISIEPGCNGVEPCLVLIAGILAYPASWRKRMAGIACGFGAIQVVNVFRVISLFYLAGKNDALFRFVHLYLWQALVMVDALVVWLLWVRHVTRRKEPISVAIA